VNFELQITFKVSLNNPITFVSSFDNVLQCFEMEILCVPIYSWIMHKVSQNNLMIEEFVGNEMTLKATLLICDPIINFDISKVSYVTHPKERFWLSMISIGY
jgi:hypothetical protein